MLHEVNESEPVSFLMMFFIRSTLIFEKHVSLSKKYTFVNTNYFKIEQA